MGAGGLLWGEGEVSPSGKRGREGENRTCLYGDFEQGPRASRNLEKESGLRESVVGGGSEGVCSEILLRGWGVFGPLGDFGRVRI